MKIMQFMADVGKNQPGMVLGMAAAYVALPIAGKAMCKEVAAITQNYEYSDKCSSACSYPKELNITLVAATSGTSGDSVIFIPIV